MVNYYPPPGAGPDSAPPDKSGETLLELGMTLHRMLSAVYASLVSRDEDVYCATTLDGAAVGFPSELVLLFALAGPSYTTENLRTMGCPFCHRPREVPDVGTTILPPATGDDITAGNFNAAEKVQ